MGTVCALCIWRGVHSISRGSQVSPSPAFVWRLVCPGVAFVCIVCAVCAVRAVRAGVVLVWFGACSVIVVGQYDLTRWDPLGTTVDQVTA
jgi:hypothetical protein